MGMPHRTRHALVLEPLHEPDGVQRDGRPVRGTRLALAGTSYAQCTDLIHAIRRDHVFHSTRACVQFEEIMRAPRRSHMCKCTALGLPVQEGQNDMSTMRQGQVHSSARVYAQCGENICTTRLVCTMGGGEANVTKRDGYMQSRRRTPASSSKSTCDLGEEHM